MTRFRAIQACLVLATFVVVWLVVTPAFAENANANVNVSSAVGYTAVFNASFAPSPARAPETTPPDLDGKAPLCDRRGAITFASAPQMQDVEVTVDTSLTPEECLGDALHAMRGGRHRASVSSGSPAPVPMDASAASTDAAMLASAVTLAAIAREVTPAPGPSTPCSRPGFRSTVDRPPRV